MKKVLLGEVLAFVLLIGGCVGVVGLFGLGVSEELENTEVADTEVEVDKTEESETESEEPVEEEAEDEDDVPREYKSALSSAKSYSDTMHMSQGAIYNQLTSEFDQFPEDAAQYAIDNLEADWNENALKSAESYRDTMEMSNAAIYDQLISQFDLFTEEQAQYAIDNLE